MFYTYVIESTRNKRRYVGTTEDLRQRLAEHNSGLGGKYTRDNRPFRLIYYEAYTSKKDAATAEKFYKTGYGREVLKGKLTNYLEHSE